ncbi:MAG TPA: hypothetical protein DHV17_01265 [Chitinophagaceae bacterium]|nr:hypothetical protein [Chitinophagaceae bacterium]
MFEQHQKNHIMADFNKDVLGFAGEGKPKLSGGLKVLTILTIIGSILSLLSAGYTYSTAQKNYEELKKAMADPALADAPGWIKGMMNERMLEVTKKMAENKMPIMIITILGAALCLYGAMEMRKLKKQGYIIWLVGEVLPLIAVLMFAGAAAFSGLGLLSIVFPVIFIILYTVYKKDLVY